MDKCCENYVATCTPKKPPQPLKQEAKFSEKHHCPTCQKDITIEFQTALTLGNHNPEYVAVAVVT